MQEPEIERPEYQDNPDVCCQALPEVVLEEQDVKGDHHGHHRKHVEHDGRLSSHRYVLMSCAEQIKPSLSAPSQFRRDPMRHWRWAVRAPFVLKNSAARCGLRWFYAPTSILRPFVMRRSAVLTAFGASVAAVVLSLPSVTQAAIRVVAPLGSPTLSSASAWPPDVTVGSAYAGPAIRAGFVGMTTEYWDMFKEVGTDPSQPDTPFEQVLENLAPDGGLDLRLGGDTTDWTWWPVPGMARPPWARWTLTPAWMAVAQKLLEDLHAHLIAGINMEADDPAVAATEVQAIESGIGPSVPTTFELGNEPELYPKWPFYITKGKQAVFGRPQSYSFPQITSEWDRLAADLGPIRLAGVSYSSFRALPHVEQFLHASPDLSLLTMHTYALTPQKCQQGGQLQEGSLFDHNSLQGLAADVGQWTTVGRKNKVPVRVDEINAVTCGGLANFSDSIGPSLSALNVLPLYAQTGVTGVNFETRPNTAQNLIQPTAASSGRQVTVQPEYYGMLAFAQARRPAREYSASRPCRAVCLPGRSRLQSAQSTSS